jgi:hypothetical protein
MRTAKMAAISAERDDWTRRALAATVAAAKDVIGVDGPIRPLTPVGRLTEGEWGWVCSSVVWAWIATRSEQAAAEGLSAERAARTTGGQPEAWDAGAVAAILPSLVEACPGLDWTAPIGAWSKDAIVEFLLTAFGLINQARAARDAVEDRIAGATHPNVVARQMNAAAGNGRMTIAELNDDCPF